MQNFIISGVNLSPGTTVLLVSPEYMTEDDVLAMKQELELRFDGVTFVFLNGDIQLIGAYPTDDLKVIES